MAAAVTIATPQHHYRTGDFLFPEISFIHIKINGDSCPIVFTDCVNLLWGGAADILFHCLGREYLKTDTLFIELVLDVIRKVCAEQFLRKRRLLGHKKPVVSLKTPTHCDVTQYMMCGHNIDRNQPAHHLRIVQRHSESDSCPSIVAHNGKLLKSKVSGNRYEILGH